ncbi:metalloendopeptidase-like membrane protein [Spongiibacter sp. IMCC21906]|uniref:M23 family metallopeptidase n=1 Tax=Spongiibacter sp. IMCC21906 TaxID=1620392 RepID=UPI00062DFA1D|nr:M23 family metallopeptidase [Spongiibacter sp. IMCC21906]AKH70093.1 metalloendopeptidase-like membrane protein [Spongiibacter sp. IMCC21906]
MKNYIAIMLFALSPSVFAEIELHGQLIQGAMVWGEVAPETRVFVGDESVKVADNGLFAFGFDRDAPEKVTLKLCAADDQCEAKVLDVEQRQYNIQRIEGVPQKTVTPPASVLDRIRKEAALVRGARAEFLYRQDFAQSFIWPLQGPITGVFGSQRVYNGSPGRPHYGVDVAGPVGAEVVAPAAGVVTLAYDDMFYSGGTLIIDHGQGISSTFIHLSKILVKEGQNIEQGQPIAEVGATGRATGPHLDWRMNWFGKRLDPELLVGDMPTRSPDKGQ